MPNPIPSPSAGCGILLVLSGVSGTGKSHLARLLVEKLDFVCARSVTTRPPRGDEERDGEKYFCSRQEFERLAHTGKLVSRAEIFGYSYAHLLSELELTDSGHNVVCQLKYSSAREFVKLHPQSKIVYIRPRRTKLDFPIAALRQRGTSQAELDARTEDMKSELLAVAREIERPDCKIVRIFENGFDGDSARTFLRLVGEIVGRGEPAPRRAIGKKSVPLPSYERVR